MKSLISYLAGAEIFKDRLAYHSAAEGKPSGKISNAFSGLANLAVRYIPLWFEASAFVAASTNSFDDSLDKFLAAEGIRFGEWIFFSLRKNGLTERIEDENYLGDMREQYTPYMNETQIIETKRIFESYMPDIEKLASEGHFRAAIQRDIDMRKAIKEYIIKNFRDKSSV